jgi:general stress protein 26
MATKNPVAELHPQFSSPNATATSWEEARKQLEEAQIYWLSTVRPDGRPHVTPLFGVWLDGAWYFCTGAGERKAKNLMHNQHCAITTGCNVVEGLDVIIEGETVQVHDEAKLQHIANAYLAKYDWQFTVRDGAFYGEGDRAEVFEVAPVMAFGFGKGEVFSQTRWRF